MQTYNIHDAKTQLSRVAEPAVTGESVMMAKAGEPTVKMVPLPSRWTC
jgi:antitoxin (DNA-binding transcriptional repressor) of toxin-antitoxin stability system